MAARSTRTFAPGLLNGRVALVTGGGTNLGRAAAAALVDAGAQVVVAGRRPEPLAETTAALGDACTAEAVDIRESGAPAGLVAAVLARHGRLDLLLGNAGGQFLAAAETITEKGWRAVARLNLEATLALCEAAHAAAFRVQGEGTILTVTVSPHHGFPAMAHSGAARAAVEAAGAELAERWGPDGTAVVSIALGRFATDSLRKYPAELWRRAAATVPLGRLGEMTEFGDLVVLLATDVGRALTGTTVTLDGALDDWSGPWPPAELAVDGEVPVEARRPAP